MFDATKIQLSKEKRITFSLGLSATIQEMYYKLQVVLQ